MMVLLWCHQDITMAPSWCHDGSVVVTSGVKAVSLGSTDGVMDVYSWCHRDPLMVILFINLDIIWCFVDLMAANRCLYN